MENNHCVPQEIRNILAKQVTINGASLSIPDVIAVARYGARLNIDVSVKTKVFNSRQYVEQAAIYATDPAISEQEKKDWLIYGITSGFGNMKDFPIASLAEAVRLQENIITSHAVGVGDYLASEIVRAMMLLRVNAFARGNSGVRYELIQLLVTLLNHNIHPLVPEQGSVGASGDLCPLAHMALVLLGKGQARIERQPKPTGQWQTLKTVAGVKALEEITTELLAEGIRLPVKLSFKEGLALTNGTNTMTAIGIMAFYDAVNVLKHADIAGALTLESIAGRSRAFDPKVHALRPHPGQITCAQNIRKLITGSQLVDKNQDVQDSYSVRCLPQVHGASRDTINYVKTVLEIELNAVTDNPLFFDIDPEVMDQRVNRQEYSAGNFHGQPIALVMDFIGIALSELGNISERRIQKLLDGNHNNGLPTNLTLKPGLNSGLMMLQYTAAALVSENKVLAHPASVDSIPTSANIEDHVSMGTIAARKAAKILKHVENIIGIELICGAQALDFRTGKLQSSPEEKVYTKTAKRIQQYLDQYLGPQEIIHANETIKKILMTQKAIYELPLIKEEELGQGTRLAYAIIRNHIPPVESDDRQELYTLLELAVTLVRNRKIIDAVEDKLGSL